MTTQVLNRLENTLEDIIKDVIKKKGLVDSGKLLKSIKVNAKFSNETFTLDITSEDYFQYLDKKYDILKDAMNSREWTAAIELAVEAFVNEYIEEQIKTIT